MELNKLQKVKRKGCIKLELNQERTTEKEASLEEYLNQNSVCTDEYIVKSNSYQMRRRPVLRSV